MGTNIVVDQVKETGKKLGLIAGLFLFVATVFGILNGIAWVIDLIFPGIDYFVRLGLAVGLILFLGFAYGFIWTLLGKKTFVEGF